jgi:bifunctional non-homologous end joining protein LigD
MRSARWTSHYRAAAGVRLITRTGYDFSGRFSLIVAALNAVTAQSCIIDGEAIICDDNGLSVFNLIHYAFAKK